AEQATAVRAQLLLAVRVAACGTRDISQVGTLERFRDGVVECRNRDVLDVLEVRSLRRRHGYDDHGQPGGRWPCDGATRRLVRSASQSRPQRGLEEKDTAVGLSRQDQKVDRGSVSRRQRSYVLTMREAATVPDAATNTKTDVAGPIRWNIADEVTQLREWGTGIAHRLSREHGPLLLGAAQDCWLRLWDPSGRISRKHAVLAHEESGWTISDLESKNGVH